MLLYKPVIQMVSWVNFHCADKDPVHILTKYIPRTKGKFTSDSRQNYGTELARLNHCIIRFVTHCKWHTGTMAKHTS
uniref:Uncharacterized protein n=1 Tax=Arundo donax TaxID=35708 RepID=A0A0A8ZML2_ARUDO